MGNSGVITPTTLIGGEVASDGGAIAREGGYPGGHRPGFAPSASYAVELLRQARTTVVVPPWGLPNLGSAARAGGEDALLTSTF